jgi:hypothetical protein
MGRKPPPPRPSPREWPPAARSDDPQTSHDGAADAARRRASQCLRMLEAYLYAGERGCTADEAAEFAGLRDPARNVCYWHRASDLRDKLLIVSFDPPRKRLGYAGSAQDVKVITDAGRVALALQSIDIPKQRGGEVTR